MESMEPGTILYEDADPVRAGGMSTSSIRLAGWVFGVVCTTGVLPAVVAPAIGPPGGKSCCPVQQ
jgi:hypothetical protein